MIACDLKVGDWVRIRSESFGGNPIPKIMRSYPQRVKEVSDDMLG